MVGHVAGGGRLRVWRHVAMNGRTGRRDDRMVDKGMWKEGNERCVGDTGGLVGRNGVYERMAGVGWRW